MSITRPEDIRLPELPLTASESERRLTQALYDQFRDDHQRLWALESTLGIAPRKAFTLTQTLTDAATVAWNMALGPVAKVTLGGARTLGAPTGLVDGRSYSLRVIQDGTGGRTLAYNAVYKWPGGVAPVLSLAAGAIDLLTFISDGTNLYGVAQLAFA